MQPLFAFVGSPSSIRITDVPEKIGTWEINRVYVMVTYPDNTAHTVECTLTGKVYVGTVQGSTRTGNTSNGYVVFADGVDENGQDVTGYQLGKGDVVIMESDGRYVLGGQVYYFHWFDEVPTNPKKGDVARVNGYLCVCDGTAWVQLQSEGTLDYNSLENKPKLNGVSIEGAKTSADFGIATEGELSGKVDKEDGKGLSTLDVTEAMMQEKRGVADMQVYRSAHGEWRCLHPDHFYGGPSWIDEEDDWGDGWGWLYTSMQLFNEDATPCHDRNAAKLYYYVESDFVAVYERNETGYEPDGDKMLVSTATLAEHEGDVTLHKTGSDVETIGSVVGKMNVGTVKVYGHRPFVSEGFEYAWDVGLETWSREKSGYDGEFYREEVSYVASSHEWKYVLKVRYEPTSEWTVIENVTTPGGPNDLVVRFEMYGEFRREDCMPVPTADVFVTRKSLPEILVGKINSDQTFKAQLKAALGV